MSVEALKSVFDVGTVVLLFLTFFFGAGVLITGSIINDRQDKQLRQFDKDLTDAKTELGKQQERAAKAERALLELQEQDKPRILNPDQKKRVAETLRPFAGEKINIFAYTGNAEIIGIAQDIAEALGSPHGAGWEISVSHGLESGYAVRGMILELRTGSTHRDGAAATALVDALKEEHLDIAGPFITNRNRIIMDAGPENPKALMLLTIGSKQ